MPKEPRFDSRLALNRWMLTRIGAASFKDLAQLLKPPVYEGQIAEQNQTRFCSVLEGRYGRFLKLPDNKGLAEYDDNITRHWRRITEERNRSGDSLQLKYFQYLALLFTEIYLDYYYMVGARGLHRELNAHLRNTPGLELPQFKESELNKVAFWMATGSGKTLLMHVNILQHLHYAQERKGWKPNNIILVTPNEGLSRQHLEEFALSGLHARLFSPDRQGGSDTAIEVLDIHKLQPDEARRSSTGKRVPAAAFEGKNLVLVDEGHRGASGSSGNGVWLQKRNQLCAQGFSFEYSATFGQAVGASPNRELKQTYAKCILFNYSYHYFHGDGYGKDYRILNLPRAATGNEETVAYRQYITACLLNFYQQLCLYRDHQEALRPFRLTMPLMVFVGGSVNAVRNKGKRKVSDVLEVLLKLADFAKESEQSVEDIRRLLRHETDLEDQGGRPLFRDAFPYLVETGRQPQAIYRDMLKQLFHAKAGPTLHVDHLRGAGDEIGLRMGEGSPYFGVINVQDTTKLCKLCRENAAEELRVVEKDIAAPLFPRINHDDSPVRMLIGSRKFSEGWSSWRVSTMGLMNIGRTEGPQIIQLFGRGVRLQGKKFSLMRSSEYDKHWGRQAEDTRAPAHVRELETLDIFGVQADYMESFKDYLEKEGVDRDREPRMFTLPVVNRLSAQKLKKLKILRPKEGTLYQRKVARCLLNGDLPADLFKPPIELDLRPRVQSAESGAAREGEDEEEALRAPPGLSEQHLCFLDFQHIHARLREFCRDRGWHNFYFLRQDLRDLLQPRGYGENWYRLWIPGEELELNSMAQVRRWQEIAIALLKKYMERVYRYRQGEYERGHLEYQELTEEDPNFFEEYELQVQRSQDSLIQELEQIGDEIRSGSLKGAALLHRLDGGIPPTRLLNPQSPQHLYAPLLHSTDSNLVSIRPVSLETGSEKDFVDKLREHCGKQEVQEALAGKEIYLLRNQSRGRGVGFFEASNFYPDFILWVLDGNRQRIAFIDPKGIQHLRRDDPKVRLHQTIKGVQEQLGDPSVILDSFILSNTSIAEADLLPAKATKADYDALHIFFQEESSHITDMFAKLLG